MRMKVLWPGRNLAGYHGKGYQWRQEDGSFLQQSGWVTIQGKKYYLQKGGIRYSGWQTFKQKKRYYLSNGVLASKRWVKDNGQFTIYVNGTPVPAGRWLTVKGRKYYIGKRLSCNRSEDYP